MMTLMPKRFEPMLTVNDPVKDGKGTRLQVSLSVNGHFVASREFDGDDELTPEKIGEWWRAEVMRRC